MDEPCPQHGEAPEPYVMQAAARPAAKALGPSFLAPEELASRALDEGTELALLLRDVPETRLRGHVQAVCEAGFSLYHSGQREGYLWHVPWGRVAAMALVVPRPPL